MAHDVLERPALFKIEGSKFGLVNLPVTGRLRRFYHYVFLIRVRIYNADSAQSVPSLLNLVGLFRSIERKGSLD